MSIVAYGMFLGDLWLISRDSSNHVQGLNAGNATLQIQ